MDSNSTIEYIIKLFQSFGLKNFSFPRKANLPEKMDSNRAIENFERLLRSVNLKTISWDKFKKALVDNNLEVLIPGIEKKLQEPNSNTWDKLYFGEFIEFVRSLEKCECCKDMFQEICLEKFWIYFV